jgi:ribonuclease HIII
VKKDPSTSPYLFINRKIYGLGDLFGEDSGFRPYIGCDESGKGDYFGPLVVAGVAVGNLSDLERLMELGVRDSKKVSNASAEKIAIGIKKSARTGAVAIEPKRYNELYEEFGNLNRILAWAYARVIDDLAVGSQECKLVIVDKFGDEEYLQTALSAIGAKYNVYQVTGAEKYPAVAAASLVARAGFLRGMKRLSGELGFELPKGAGNVTETGLMIVGKFGGRKLGEVAKLHFKTTRQILGG